MRYRVAIAGRTFEVDVEGDERPSVTVKPHPPVAAELVRVAGTLHDLRLGTRVVAVEVSARLDGGLDVQLPGRRALACHVEDARGRTREKKAGGKTGPQTVRAVMPGIVRSIAVEPGKAVQKGDALLVLEAMKMQNEIKVEAPGVVARVFVKPGQSLAAGEPLVEIAPPG